VNGQERSDQIGDLDWVVRAMFAVNRLGVNGFHSLTVLRRCRLPRRGPAILVCNHTSSLDPALLQAASPRMIRWMMAREYDSPGLRWFFRKLGVIMVERSGRDAAATRAALRLLEQGAVVGIFPEGKIETTTQLLPFHSGIALLALKSGAPVFPAYLDGWQRGRGMLQAIVAPSHATLSFGPPLRFDRADPGRQQLPEIARRIQEAVGSLSSRLPRMGSRPA
jgi:1-acyl-sn-glycerol-3-phosphate acyltransferase